MGKYEFPLLIFPLNRCHRSSLSIELAASRSSKLALPYPAASRGFSIQITGLALSYQHTRMATRFTHAKASTGHDSRRFATRRRKSCFGYFETPVVDDTLSFLLPPFSRVHSRVVVMKGKTWEAWSPNSTVNVFYPGIRAPGYRVAMEADQTK